MDFAQRHNGPDAVETDKMLTTVGVSSLGDLIDQTVPEAIRFDGELDLPTALDEVEVLSDLRELAESNVVMRSMIGQGYYDTLTPTVILRNILEDPGWYTAYTPYQAEIAQGRMQALLNFQTMVADLTGTELSNASLLDEATAAAEAMTMARRLKGRSSTASTFVASDACHPQTLAVLATRAEPLGINLVIGSIDDASFDEDTFGVLVQYPDTRGVVSDHAALAQRAHDAGALVVAATDLLACTMLTPPGEWGADIVVGSSQRFGVPLGAGGPHAAFLATATANARNLPGRLISVSKDPAGNPALRMALQTREQHIRRDSATSNICTAQVLLAVIASMYGVYHGPEGITAIGERVHGHARAFGEAAVASGYTLEGETFFDTVTLVAGDGLDQLVAKALGAGFNLRAHGDGAVGIAFDETTTADDLHALTKALFGREPTGPTNDTLGSFRRSSQFMTHPVFNSYRSETEMLRYITALRNKDLSLTHSMIALGSCTMKLNATTEMIPITWEGFGRIHPFAPADQQSGYAELVDRLERWLAEITGFAGTSLQPNAGSQGEYAGLLTIAAYHRANGQGQRNVCIIPTSAHGTNPASAVMAGMTVVPVATDENGNIDVADLEAKAVQHADDLAALMVTYPSTHGVFEESIEQVCQIIHDHGGQVYLDGANMNAQVGLSRPGDYGADVCHLNLHKTFCIPHGGGGPGVGPICAAAHLVPHLPDLQPDVEADSGMVSAAPWGSTSILPISYAYIAMMGPDGLLEASRLSILNANYMAARLDPHFPVLYRGANGRVAHECIIDVRDYKDVADAEDIAKRLIDYGFHAPTMSWPVAGTLMIEPTESESLAEIDRFCDALISIREEIRAIQNGDADAEDNVLKNAPHTAMAVTSDEWSHPYSRQQAAYPAPWSVATKFWPTVGRVDNAFGDRNLQCACPPMSAYA
ncbi:MAG: aminomethyl-transferring glycine dehydrogenase [Acidimicrobiales bacterium]|nr:aminomethyl-transferring glycine dehydrogenase [Acidimicrobiales bacterium]RZV46707.1 MAG: glycine dehydrogenase (aminomethyl-transferring) [Acidimicrobiales bacterium]